MIEQTKETCENCVHEIKCDGCSHDGYVCSQCIAYDKFKVDGKMKMGFLDETITREQLLDILHRELPQGAREELCLIWKHAEFYGATIADIIVYLVTSISELKDQAIKERMTDTRPSIALLCKCPACGRIEG